MLALPVLGVICPFERTSYGFSRGFHLTLSIVNDPFSVRYGTGDSSAKAAKEIARTARESPRPAPVPGLAGRLTPFGACVVRVPGPCLALSSTRDRTAGEKSVPGGWKGEGCEA